MLKERKEREALVFQGRMHPLGEVPPRWRRRRDLLKKDARLRALLVPCLQRYGGGDMPSRQGSPTAHLQWISTL